jgi:hypothetical protein
MNSAYGNTRLARRLVWVAAVCNVAGFVLWCPLASQSSGALVLMLLLGLVANSAVGAFAVRSGLAFEWLQIRRWKAVCRGIGFVGEGRLQFKTRLAFDPLSSIQKGHWERKTIYPKLREIYGKRDSWTGIVTPFAGQNVDDYNQEASRFAMAFNARFISFERTDEGLIRLSCGQMQVPEPYEYPIEQAAVQASPYAGDVGGMLRAIPMAKRLDGSPWYMPIEENHVLIVGRTGAGKNSWTWSLVFGLAEARKAGIVRLWGLDPKKVELAFGRQWWDEYADTVDGMIELLEKAVNELLERNKLIQGKARKITPSPEMPLNVIIIDELAYLSAAVDKKTQEHVQQLLRTILWLGRATGYVVVACSQDARKSVTDERDYFPTKVALAMEAPMVDLVLGKGAHDDYHAYCEQIPLREAGAGCAYVREEMGEGMLLVRAAWCSDQAIRMMMAKPQAFGVQVQSETTQQYEQGHAPQLDWNDQPLRQFNTFPDWQYKVE